MSDLADVWIGRHRSQHLININRARNLALARGIAVAEWVLPLDGWCYLTARSWSKFEAATQAAPGARYLIMPLRRLDAWPDQDAARAPVKSPGEPQIAFRRDAADRFDETLRYGERNKAELLAGLGVPGPWLDWRPVAWDPHQPQPCADRGRWAKAGSVYRLPSTAAAQVELSDKERHAARLSGVARLASDLDQAALCRTPLRLFTRRLDDRLGEPLVAQWLASPSVQAETARLSALPLATVLDKTELLPSGLMNDYLSLPRYFHREGDRYVPIDGVTGPENIRGTVESRAYDKFSLADFFAVTATSTLTGGAESGGFAPAREWLLAWLVDPRTRMRPHGRFAQWIPGPPGRPSSWGLIDLREAWMLPPLIQLLFARGVLSAQERQACLRWCASLCDDIVSGPQGAASFRRPNNIGAWTHLLVMALAIFTGRYAYAAACLRDVTVRLYQHLGERGDQPEELVRATPLHYALFNLTAWTVMANYLRNYDYDLWRYAVGGEPPLSRMFESIRMEKFADYQTDPRKFDNWMLLLQTLRPENARDPAAIANLSRIDWT